MPDSKISGLTAVVTPDLTDEFVVNQGGVSKKITRQQLIDQERYMLRADAARNLTSQTTRQPIFAAGQNTLTLPVGIYRFEMMLYLTSMSSTTGNAQIDLLGAGNAVASAWLWQQTGIDATAPATAAAQTGGTNITGISAAPALLTATGTAMAIRVEGTFEITTAGTFIPSILLTTAAAASLAIGSYFWAERVSTSTTLTGLGPVS